MRTLAAITFCAALVVPALASAASSTPPQATRTGHATPVSTQSTGVDMRSGRTATEDKLRDEACTKQAHTEHVKAKDHRDAMKTCMEHKAREVSTHAPKAEMERDVQRTGAGELSRK